MTRRPAPIITVTLNPAVDKALEVPGFHVGAHARATVQSLLPAGKGVNVARGLARLGGNAVACGLVGRDEERMFAESLAADGVRACFRTVAGHTRTNTTILDPDARTTTHLREQGFEVTAADLDGLRDHLTVAVAEEPGVVVFAGSLPPGISPEGFAGLVEAAAGAGGRVVIDTNGPALAAALDTGVVDTAKPNMLELAECLGRSIDRPDAPTAATGLLDRVGTVLLTLGEEGALRVGRDGVSGFRCPLAEGELGNTVGCGDAFLAGWLYGGRQSDDPLRWAVAAGAASAMSDTTVGYDRAHVRALLSRCEPIDPRS